MNIIYHLVLANKTAPLSKIVVRAEGQKMAGPSRKQFSGSFTFLVIVATFGLIGLTKSKVLPADNIALSNISFHHQDQIQDDYEILEGETVTRIGTCHNGKTLVEIHFNSTAVPRTLITVCHDESTDFTLWSKHYIFGEELENAEGGGNRPSFKEAGFYPNISTDNCYKQVTQTETIGLLLNSTKLANHYVQPSKQLFLARGHLTPNGDPIKAVEKHATFYFINASPQWQTINGGNWVDLEVELREMAKNGLATLTVWTGSYGITKLKNEEGTPVEIWLGRDFQGNLVKKLPVNHLTWKVIHDPATRTGVAIVQINNPWIESVTSDDILCDDVCDQLEWITWNIKDIVKGYTYCCTVSSFREKVDYAPDLGDLPLLKSL